MSNETLPFKSVVQRKVGTPQERIMWIRKNQRQTQEAMAVLIGTTRSNYANKESSGHSFSIEQISLIGELFSVNMNWLFYGDGKPYRKRRS